MSTALASDSRPRVAPANLALRPIQPEDEALLLAIFASTREEERQLLGWPDAAWDAFVRQQFSFQHTQYQTAYANPSFLLVLCDGEVAGRLYLDRNPSEIRLVDLALLPAWRRRGIGRLLLESLVVESDANGIPIGLHVERNNPILGYYQRLGFQLEADKDVYLYLRRPSALGPLPPAQDFAPWVGTDFVLVLPRGASAASLRLVEVTPWKGQRNQVCSLHFTGPDIGRPAHDTYTLVHPHLGRFPLFLGPVTGGAAGDLSYQAVITRLNPLPEEELLT